MKRSKDWNKAKYERFIREGRGQGDLENYKPWLTIQDIPSRGRATRVFGWKTNRIHHFFSDIQTRFFYLLEWEDNVIDIKEHYPLLDLKETIDYKDINIEKYRAEDGTDYVFTTTFLIKVLKDGKEYFVARSIKASHELESKGTIDRFEFERRYWGKKGVDWGIVTNKEIPNIKAQNIEWLHSTLELEHNEIFSWHDKENLCNDLLGLILKNLYRNTREIINEFDYDKKLEQGTGLLIFKYLIMKKIIHVDINKRINIEAPIKDLLIDISR